MHQKIYCNLAPELSIFDVIINPSSNCLRISFTLFFSSFVTNEKIVSPNNAIPHLILF